MRLDLYSPVKVEVLTLSRINPQVFRDQRVVACYRFLVIGRRRDQGSIVEIQYGIQAKGAECFIAAQEGFAPAKRYRIGKVNVADSPKDGEEKQYKADHKTDSDLSFADAGGGALQ